MRTRAPAERRTHVALRGARRLAERPGAYGRPAVRGRHRSQAAAALCEAELTALWLLGRVPGALLPWPLLRAGRAGRGPGPDVREALFLLPSGVARSGAVEVHLRASDFARHGHDRDTAYAGAVLHLVWEADRGEARGAPLALPGGGTAPTVEAGPALGGDAGRLRTLLRRGPSGVEPCGPAARARGPEATRELLRAEGGRRLAERSWGAARLPAAHGWAGAWLLLLDHALERSAGRRRETPPGRLTLAEAVTAALTDRGAVPVERALARLAEDRRALLAALRGGGRTGGARAAEVGWNAALPLLAALAAAYDDVALARRTARLADGWPAPRPYGRTRALDALLGAPGGGALGAQGLLRMQELWCSRGGCGVCPLSPGAE